MFNYHFQWIVPPDQLFFVSYEIYLSTHFSLPLGLRACSLRLATFLILSLRSPNLLKINITIIHDSYLPAVLQAAKELLSCSCFKRPGALIPTKHLHNIKQPIVLWIINHRPAKSYLSSYSNYMRLHHNPWWKGPALWYLHRLSESNSLLMFSVFRTSLFSIVLNLSLCFWWSVPPSRHFWITEHSCRLCGSLYVQFLTAVTLFRILYAKSWNYVWAKAQSPLLMMPVWQLRISKSMWWTCSVLSLNVSVL